MKKKYGKFINASKEKTMLVCREVSLQFWLHVSHFV